jgi:hypothetical protein
VDDFISPSLDQVIRALGFIVPLLEKTGKPWIITGGFACTVYGVERALSDIDIDIDCAHGDAEFVDFMNALAPSITSPLENYISEHYDNYNMEATYDDVILDFCPGADLKLFDPAIGKHELAYKNGFPTPVMVPFHGFNLPLLPIDAIIAQKMQLQRPVDLMDIAALQKLI